MWAFEHLWAMQMLHEDYSGPGTGPGDGAGSAEATAKGLLRRPNRMALYLKVGAGALGGAALLAITGGAADWAWAAPNSSKYYNDTVVVLCFYFIHFMNF